MLLFIFEHEPHDSIFDFLFHYFSFKNTVVVKVGLLRHFYLSWILFMILIVLQKIIPLQEITALRRAKTAGIFPNAIEILVGEKKFFFASFLSRDEAFNLINDGWSQQGKGTEAILTKQVKNCAFYVLFVTAVLFKLQCNQSFPLDSANIHIRLDC